jgi:Fe-S-cluster-containing dehydrogenase component
VEVCPTDALVFGDIDDSGSEIAKLLASGKTEILHPEYRLGEKVSYIGLPRGLSRGQ